MKIISLKGDYFFLFLPPLPLPPFPSSSSPLPPPLHAIPQTPPPFNNSSFLLSSSPAPSLPPLFLLSYVL